MAGKPGVVFAFYHHLFGVSFFPYVKGLSDLKDYLRYGDPFILKQLQSHENIMFSLAMLVLWLLPYLFTNMILLVVFLRPFPNYLLLTIFVLVALWSLYHF